MCPDELVIPFPLPLALGLALAPALVGVASSYTPSFFKKSGEQSGVVESTLFPWEYLFSFSRQVLAPYLEVILQVLDNGWGGP